MKKSFLPNLALVLSVISIILVFSKLAGIIEIPIIAINLLFITLMSIRIWINYKNNNTADEILMLLEKY